MAVRLTDIAKRAGVDYAVVSAVVNCSKSTAMVSEKNRRRILQIAKELGYVPNSAASALVKGQTHVIGVICHKLTDPNLLNAIAHIEQLSRAYDYNIQISTIENSPNWPSLLRRGQVDLLVSLGIQMLHDSHLEISAELHPRIVVVGPTPQPQESENHARQWGLQACWDDAEMGRMGGEYLSQLGHQYIGMLEGKSFPYTHARIRGAKSAVEASGGRVEIATCEDEKDMSQAGQVMTLELLKEYPDMTAIFMRNDLFYPGVLAALNQAGLRVPEDISVFGCMGFYPMVTGIRSPILKGVEKILIPFLQNGQLVKEDVLLIPEFNPGQTCARPKSRS